MLQNFLIGTALGIDTRHRTTEKLIVYRKNIGIWSLFISIPFEIDRIVRDRLNITITHYDTYARVDRMMKNWFKGLHIFSKRDHCG